MRVEAAHASIYDTNLKRERSGQRARALAVVRLRIVLFLIA